MFPIHSEMTSLLRVCEWQIKAEFRLYLPLCLLNALCLDYLQSDRKPIKFILRVNVHINSSYQTPKAHWMQRVHVIIKIIS